MSLRDEIMPGLFVGSRPPPGRHKGIDTIVLAAEEYQLPPAQFPGTEVLHVPLDDDPTRPMREDEIEAAIHAAGRVARRVRSGRRVLVSCALGLNRSALVAGLAMIDLYRMSPDAIVARIRRARGPWALSNPNFEKLIRVVGDLRASRAHCRDQRDWKWSGVDISSHSTKRSSDRSIKQSSCPC